MAAVPVTPPRHSSTVRPWLLYLIASIIAVLPRLLSLDMPFERDEGAYACVADGLARGELPYVDVFDHKPPGIYYIYRASFALFGRTVVAPRLAALVAVGIAAFLLAQFIARRTGHLSAGLGSALLFGFASTSIAIAGPTANTEVFTLPFIVAGVALLTALPLRPGLTALGAGLAFGIAAMIKQPAALIGAATAAAALLGLRKQPVVMFRAGGAFALGATIPFAGFCGLYASQGNFTPFWDCFYRYNSDYVAILPWRYSLHLGWTNLLRLFHDEFLLWGLALAGFVLPRRQPSSGNFFWVWLLSSTGAVALGRTYYSHYFVFLLPALACGVGLALARLTEAGLGACRLVLLLTASGLLFYYPQWKLSGSELNEAIYQDTLFVQAQALGRQLYESGRGDTAFILGAEPEIYFHAEFRPVSRFIYGYPLITPNRHRVKYRREVQAALAATPPEWLIVQPGLFDWQQGEAFLASVLTPFANYRLVAIERPDLPEIVTAPPALSAALRSGLANRLLVFRRQGSDATPDLRAWASAIGLPLAVPEAKH